MGRPTAMTSKVCETILVRLASGESMARICRDKAMPNETTVYRHIFADDDFRQSYELAREIQAERAVDEMIEIADDGRNDWIENNDPNNPGYRMNGENVQRSRLRIDARKWTAMKLRPKKYGDRIDHKHSGEAENPIIAILKSMGGRSALPVGEQARAERRARHCEAVEVENDDG